MIRFFFSQVGPKTNRKSTECLTNHLTTFGSNFFVAPNAINFDELSVAVLLNSPHALIAVCVILGIYMLSLIPARRADRSDALKVMYGLEQPRSQGSFSSLHPQGREEQKDPWNEVGVIAGLHVYKRGNDSYAYEGFRF